jgi:hypothetical protein
MGIGICLCQCPEWIAVSLFTVSGLLILGLLATIGVYMLIYTPYLDDTFILCVVLIAVWFVWALTIAGVCSAIPRECCGTYGA